MFTMKAGACFVYDGGAITPFTADEKYWPEGTYEPTGDEVWIAQRHLDGVTVAVFRCPDNKYRAQPAASCRTTPRAKTKSQP